MVFASYWENVPAEACIRQGEYLENCRVPSPKLAKEPTAGETLQAVLDVFDAIVITQGCDLEQGKTPNVSLCPVFPVRSATGFKRSDLNLIRKGQLECLHLLSPFENLDSFDDWMIVDIRTIYCVPMDYARLRIANQSSRWALRSPYCEHFSQAVGRCFMRVGLPSDQPRF